MLIEVLGVIGDILKILTVIAFSAGIIICTLIFRKWIGGM
jgi:hypothetical protein